MNGGNFMVRKQSGAGHLLPKCLVCGSTKLKVSNNKDNQGNLKSSSVTCENCRRTFEINMWEDEV